MGSGKRSALDLCSRVPVETTQLSVDGAINLEEPVGVSQPM
jgi:hypothetical protein